MCESEREHTLVHREHKNNRGVDWVWDEQEAGSQIQLFKKKLIKKFNMQFLNYKNVLTSTFNLAAILNFHAWQH
jgi:hypothetical protein